MGGTSLCKFNYEKYMIRSKLWKIKVEDRGFLYATDTTVLQVPSDLILGLQFPFAQDDTLPYSPIPAKFVIVTSFI